jgi:hypothetical protein
MSFLWDAYQSSQISQLNSRIDRLQDSGAREQAAVRVATELEEKVNRLALICRAMFELLQQTSGLSEDQLKAKIQEIDLRDGQADGRMTPQGKRCPKCDAMMSPRFGRCLFCGHQDEAASPFVP